MSSSSLHGALAALLFAALPLAAQSQLVSYEFSNHDLDPSVHESFVNATPMSTPLAFMFGGGKFCAGSAWATTTPQGPFNQSSSYLEWTVSPDHGCTLILDELVIESWRGGGVRDTIEFGALYFDEIAGPGGDDFQNAIATVDLYPQHSGADTVVIDLSGVAALQGAAGAVTFRLYMYGDGNSGSSAAEFERFELRGSCGGRVVCERAYASEVLGAMQGSNPIGGANDPTDALGRTSAFFSLGRGGELAVGFGNVFTTTGDGDDDLYIWEYNSNDCYGVGLRPADAATRQILENQGLTPNANGFYVLQHLFCGTEYIDLDAFLGGVPAETARFDGVQILDDGSQGDGMEVKKVKAELRCNEALLGDRVWTDVDCDGIQDPRELGLADIPVTLYDSTGSVVLANTTTDGSGHYAFRVGPGAYVVEVGVDPVRFTVTAKAAGSDTGLDSDIDPTTHRTEPILVSEGGERRDVDAGLCVICTGYTPITTSLQACGLPVDPVLSATQPIVGSLFTLSIDSSLPGAVVLLFAQTGGPTTLSTVAGNGSNICNIHLDLQNLTLVQEGLTDANGQWSWTFPISAKPEHLGLRFTVQARLCLPGTPGPIPGFPDFLSTGLDMTIGCP